MATIYKGKIGKKTDWGGDSSTSGMPVAGSSVQEFLKGEINGKIGAVYKPEGGNSVYYFASNEDKQAYIDTHDDSLVVDSFELGSNYSVKIEEGFNPAHSVIDGVTGNTIDFGFKIVDENDMTADAIARVEFSFTGSGISNKFTTEIPINAGDWTRVSTNIDNYLRTGYNRIIIKITGLSTQATSQFAMTYNLFNLSFNPTFEYNSVQTGLTMLVPFIIECSDPKVVEFYIDGIQVRTMEISDIRYDGRATLDISNLSIGQHSLQVRAYVRATDGTIFYAPSHYYTFAKEGNTTPSFLMHREIPNTEGIIAPGETLKINVYQFEQVMFDWSIYDYRQRRLIVNFEYDGDIVSSVVANENGRVNTFNYRPMNFGDGKHIRIYALGEDDELIFENIINLDVAESASGIKETTDGLLLKLQARGRRNSDENKDVWECTGSDGNRYFATFNNFSWNAQQGWDENTESLVISNGATVEFNIAPMVWDWVSQGGTVEIDLETFDIDDDDAVICECMDKTGQDTAFFRMTATEAKFSTSRGVSISTRYKDNERIKIAFIGNKGHNVSDDDNLIYIVINGVLERAAMYRSDNEDRDRMFSRANLSIGDLTGNCSVRLRSIRVYDRAISVDQAFNNFVIDSDNVQEIYEKNNVLKAGSATEIGFDEVANKLPVMIFTGDMDDIVKNGQDKEWRRFDVEYINRQEPERNFVSFNCQMKLQGTSSLGYPRKNFKLKTRDKTFNADAYAISKFELDPNSVVGNRMLRNKVTGEAIDFDDFKTNGTIGNTQTFTLDFEGKPLKKGNYRFRKDCHKASKWTLKADFMESSCSHNVGAGRSWNDIFENTELRYDSETVYTNQTYKDEALTDSREYIEYDALNIEGDATHYKIPNNTQAIKDQKKYVCRTDAQKICRAEGQDDIRTAIDGFPMVCFYRRNHTSNNLVFIGQYNFINDKSSFEVFGFEDIEDPNDPTEETMIYDATKVEVFEGLKNTNPLSLFKTSDGFYDRTEDDKMFKWQETYESRYPDTEDALTDPFYGRALESGVTALYELTKWLVSTRHVSGETQYSGTIDIDATFAKHINDYQYGYTDETASRYQYAEGVGLEDNAENRQKKFETEKWEHFDVWKLAGYYIYLRRYGAVDQFVKNTMLFTDGNGKYELKNHNGVDRTKDLRYRKWFFINYDNDCLFGLRNNGQLAFHWDLDRQTLDSAADILVDDQADNEGGMVNAYAMMGHDSTLWNNLEADDEFMRMVRDLDYSMTKYKLTYDNMVEEFDTKQTEQWCERIYNANERYKYINAAKGIGDMAGNPVDNLWMLQGTRRSHRHWWIANHFNLLDAQWLSGDYKLTKVELKTNSPAGVKAHCIAGADFYFAWGQLNRKLYESNMVRKEGEVIDFVFSEGQSQGDPVVIYGFNKMSEMDFSEMAPYAQGGSFKFSLGNDLVQNTMKKLIIGNPSARNNLVSYQDTETWVALPNLEYLDITNFAGITSVPLTSFRNLHAFKAFGSSLASFAPAEGAKFDLVELPNTIKTLSLNNISFTRGIADDLKYTPNSNLDSLMISNSDGVGPIYYTNVVLPWIEAINASPQAALLYSGKSLILRNVKWAFGNLDAIRLLKNFKNSIDFQMTGVIDLLGCGNLSMENINEIKEVFGENCFNEKMSPLYVKTPNSVFIESEKDTMVAGQTNVFKRTIYPDERVLIGTLTSMNYYIVAETDIPKADAGNNTIFEDPIKGQNYIVIEDPNTVRNGLSLTQGVDENGKQIGILSSQEYVLNTDSSFLVLVSMVTIDDTNDKISVMRFNVKDPTYGTHGTMSGLKSLYSNGEYRFTLNPKTATEQVPIGSYNVSWSLTGAAVEQYVDTYGVDANNQLEFVVKMNSDQPEISSKMTIIADITNHDGTSYRVSYNILALNENVIMTSDSNPVAMAKCYEAGYSDGNPDAMTKAQAEAVTNLGTTFKDANTAFTFNELVFFTGLTSLSASAFAGSKLTEIVIPENISSIGEYCFANCSLLENVYVERVENGNTIFDRTLPSSITTIKEGTFAGCSSLKELALPDSVTSIERYAFGRTGFDRVILPSTEMESGDLKFSQALSSIDGYAFETERWSPATTTNRLKHFEVPANLTGFTNNFALFGGRNYESFVVDPENTMLEVTEDGVLVSKAVNNRTLLRYAPKSPETETYTMPTVLFVNQYAFFAVENLHNLIGNPSVQVLGEGFCRESKMEVVDLSVCVNIGNGLIPQDAFRACSNLKHAYLPLNAAITKIGTHAFDGCVNLEEIEFPGTLTEFVSDSSGLSFTFVGCSKISAVTFPDTVTVMGRSVLRNMSGLKNVVFPAYYKHSEGFQTGGTNWHGIAIVENCPNVTGVTFPAFSIDKEIEGGETESVQINDFPYSYRWYRNVNYIDGGSSTEFLGFQIIRNGMDNLEEALISDKDNGKSFVSVGGVIYTADMKNVVFAPKAIDTLVIPQGAENINGFSFVNASRLRKVVLPDGIKSIGKGAFENSGLEEINFPNSLISIDEEAFATTKLRTVEITSTVSLGRLAFDGVGNLETVRMRFANVIDESTPAWAKFIFRNCINLRDVYISCDIAPTMLETVYPSNPDQLEWHQFVGAGKSLSESDRKLYVSYGTASQYTSEENNLTWGWLFSDEVRTRGWNRTLVDGFALSGYCYATIFDNGTPYTGIVYAKSEADHLIGNNDETYSTTIDGGKYMFELDGVFDNELITLYSDAECTNEIGSFRPRLFETEYQIGEPSFGLRKSSILGAANEGEEEMADITKSEYEALVSKVNQMMRILKKMVK